MTTSNTPTPPPGGTGPSSAVEAFEAFLDREAENPTPQKRSAAQQDAPADDAEALAAEAELDETPLDDAPEGSEEDGADDVEAMADDDDADEDPEPEANLVTVKIDGKEERLPLDEVVKGYQRQAIFTQKTQQLAAERSQLHGELNEIREERQQYATLLSALEQTLAEMQPQEPDWGRLYEEDPLEYVRQRDVWNDRAQKLQKIHAEKAYLSQQEAQARAMATKQQIELSKQKLLEAIPEWQDKSRWDADRVALREYGLSMGYSDEELNAAYDHKAIVILNKAMKYDRMMAKRPKAATSKGPRTASAGSATAAPRSQTKQTKAKQRLAKSGSIHDAAALFETLL